MMTRTQVQILQVMLMILIVLHNASNLLLGPWPWSEFDWQPNYLNLFFSGWMKFSWKIIPLNLIAMGYTAVASFLILTGYGLSKRYEHENLIFWPYFKQRLKYLMLPWIVMAIWMESVMAHPPNLFSWLWMFSSLQMWRPHHQCVLVGTWWFLLMIFELYLIFPVLLSFYKKFGIIFILMLWGLQYFSQTVINPWTEFYFDLNLNFTPFAALMPISLGMFLANFKKLDFFLAKKKFKFLLVLIFLFFIFFIGQINLYTWPFCNTALGLFFLGLGWILLPKEKEPGVFLKHLCTLIVPVFLIHEYLCVFIFRALDNSNINFLIYLGCLIFLLTLTYISAVLLKETTKQVLVLIA